MALAEKLKKNKTKSIKFNLLLFSKKKDGIKAI
jgi:hypothetical protein